MVGINLDIILPVDSIARGVREIDRLVLVDFVAHTGNGQSGGPDVHRRRGKIKSGYGIQEILVDRVHEEIEILGIPTCLEMSKCDPIRTGTGFQPRIYAGIVVTAGEIGGSQGRETVRAQRLRV